MIGLQKKHKNDNKRRLFYKVCSEADNFYKILKNDIIIK